MIICDMCKGKIGDNHIQISVRGEQRMKLYDLGLESTQFDVCSPKCGISLLSQVEVLMPKVVEWDL